MYIFLRVILINIKKLFYVKFACYHNESTRKVTEQILENENITLLNNNVFIRHNFTNWNFLVIDLSLKSPSILLYISKDNKTNFCRNNY